MPVVEEVKAEEPAPVVEAPKPEPVPEPQPEPTPAPVVEPAPAAEEEKLRRWLQNPYRFLTRSLLPLQPKKLFRKIKKKRRNIQNTSA